MLNNRKQTIFVGISILIGILGAIGILILGEVAVRMGTNVTFLGNSANLFEPKRFGPSRGNAPNIQGVSFQATVYTDGNGFRIPRPDYQYPQTQHNKVLILGDSVAFGTGVAEEKTFVGLLRASRPDWAIFNAAVIGYGVDDYLNCARSLIDKGQHYKFAVLAMCLNDVSSNSAMLLDNPSVSRTAPLVERIRALTFAAAANEWLREHSKLYLYAKGLVTDPSARYFYADYLNYNDNVDQKLRVVEALVSELHRANIPLFIVISPYEYQLRKLDIKAPKGQVVADPMLPQRRIAAFLRDKGVTTYDPADFFLSQASKGGSIYFLPFDPMHFSESGHMIMFRFIDRLIQNKVF